MQTTIHPTYYLVDLSYPRPHVLLSQSTENNIQTAPGLRIVVIVEPTDRLVRRLGRVPPPHPPHAPEEQPDERDAVSALSHPTDQ